VIAAYLLGCGGAPQVPDGTVLVTIDDAGVHVAGGGAIDQRTLESDPTNDVEPALVTALSAAAGHPARIDVPPDLPFWKLRRVLGSAREAGAGPLSFRVGDAERAVEVVRPDRYDLGFRCAEPVPVSGVEPLVTLSVQSGVDGAWVVATATFLPVGPGGPVDGHAPTCLSVPACDALYPDPERRAACARGDGARRVELGGEWGCLLPIAKTPTQVSEWRRLLPGLVERLGLRSHRLRVVMPEARIRADAVAAVLDGLADAGLPTALGTESLVEGNDGPPVCMATVRDAATLANAEAAWLGSVRAAADAAAGGDGGGAGH
jgi:hypothetical protein